MPGLKTRVIRHALIEARFLLRMRVTSLTVLRNYRIIFFKHDAPAAVKPRRCKSKDRLTLTPPVLNPNAEPEPV
jgi:hypothetical protein